VTTFGSYVNWRAVTSITVAGGGGGVSSVATMANGSPEAFAMTDAKARTGWSAVNSSQRFVSVVPATPGKVPPSSRRF